MNQRGLTLLEVLILIILVGILGTLLIPWRGPGEARRVACANNLSRLYRLASVYASTHRGEWPATGEDPWLLLARTKPPLIEPEQIDVLHCPVRGEAAVAGRTDYRGPKVPWTQLGAGDPVAADKDGNHGKNEAGNILLKDGSLIEARPQDPIWRQCASKLSP